MLRALLALCGISWGVFFSAQIAFAVEIDVYLNEIFYDAIGSDTGQEFTLPVGISIHQARLILHFHNLF
jgi:hypothetical protein